MSPAQFDLLLDDMLAYASGRDALARRTRRRRRPGVPACAVDVVTETAWHALFIRNLLRARGDDAAHDATILQLPGFVADPARHGTRTGTVIALDMTPEHRSDRRHRLCRRDQEVGVLAAQLPRPARAASCPMHCSANIGADGDTALFFGLSGTGKTTLSSDPARPLIGDDEHLWSDSRHRQYRGRLLRQDRPAQRHRRARDLRRGAKLRHRARKRRARRDGERRFRRSVAAPKTPAPPIRSTTLERRRPGRQRRASPRPWCSSPPTPSASCRRSRG